MNQSFSISLLTGRTVNDREKSHHWQFSLYNHGITYSASLGFLLNHQMKSSIGQWISFLQQLWKLPLIFKLRLLFIISFLFLQSKLAHIGESRMEMDYKLVENEGLFQEYLEMGKYFRPVFEKCLHINYIWKILSLIS